MKRKLSESESRKLIDRIAWTDDIGPLRGVLATTFDLNPEFFETDFLPSLLGLGAWDDRRYSSRIQMERELAKADAVSVFMDARRYQGRPRSLRVELVPARGEGGQTLHAKVLLLVHESAVRLFVSSANLTGSGYRLNREVALSLLATRDKPAEGSLIRAAIEPMPGLLSSWWTDGAARVIRLARERLDAWKIPALGPDEDFLWGGGEMPLHAAFVARWPTDEAVRRISIVSPFWSSEHAQGPIGALLEALSARAPIAGAELQLFTSAAPDTQSSYRPVLPPELSAFDGRQFKVKAIAMAVDPRVDKEELDGKGDDLMRERQLHAKVVLVEGPRTSLLYLGSANFTARGFGFLSKPRRANLEAGVILRRIGKAREMLAALIPKSTGEAVPLEGRATPKIAVPEPAGSEHPWPSFLKTIMLSPSATNPDELELSVEVSKSQGDGAFSVLMPDKTPLLQDVESTNPLTHRVAVDGDRVHALLKEQFVLVVWAASKEPIRFPLNVALAARDRIPLSPGDHRPGERHLLAYYQGRIAWEELFPDEEENSAGRVLMEETTVDPGTGVDTSKIQSYQIREFVEALKGIHDDLRECVVSEPAMRLSLLGPISPVALALEIMRRVRANARSPIAGAFQLIELLACLGEAARWKVEPKLREPWGRTLAEARGKIEHALGELRLSYPEFFKHAAFRRYEEVVLGQYDVGGDR